MFMQVDLKKLKEAMAQRRWNWMDISRATGLAYSTIRRLFTEGSGHVDTLDKVTRALGVPYEEVVSIGNEEDRSA